MRSSQADHLNIDNTLFNLQTASLSQPQHFKMHLAMVGPFAMAN
jgi:hypothetical protein